MSQEIMQHRYRTVTPVTRGIPASPEAEAGEAQGLPSNTVHPWPDCVTVKTSLKRTVGKGLGVVAHRQNTCLASVSKA